MHSETIAIDVSVEYNNKVYTVRTQIPQHSSNISTIKPEDVFLMSMGEISYRICKVLFSTDNTITSSSPEQITSSSPEQITSSSPEQIIFSIPEELFEI